MESIKAVSTVAAALLIVFVVTAAGTPRSQTPDGRAVFVGKGFCHGCHGPDGRGTPLGPDLTDDEWLNIAQGSREEISKLVRTGVARPKKFATPMPPMGGARLSAAEIDAVAGYVAGLRNR